MAKGRRPGNCRGVAQPLNTVILYVHFGRKQDLDGTVLPIIRAD